MSTGYRGRLRAADDLLFLKRSYAFCRVSEDVPEELLAVRSDRWRRAERPRRPARPRAAEKKQSGFVLAARIFETVYAPMLPGPPPNGGTDLDAGGGA